MMRNAERETENARRVAASAVEAATIEAEKVAQQSKDRVEQVYTVLWLSLAGLGSGCLTTCYSLTIRSVLAWYLLSIHSLPSAQCSLTPDPPAKHLAARRGRRPRLRAPGSFPRRSRMEPLQ